MIQTGSLSLSMLALVRFQHLASFCLDHHCSYESTIDFRANKPSDVISTLVSIYDSKDLFVKELQVLLAQRLLAITDDNSDKVEKEVYCRLVLISHDIGLTCSPHTASKHRDFENSVRRSCPAGLRGDAEGHDGLQTHRRACAISESCMLSFNPPAVLLTQSNILTVNCPSYNHLSSLLAATGLRRYRHAWPIPCVRIIQPLELFLVLMFSWLYWDSSVCKISTRKNSLLSSRTRDYGGYLISVASISNYSSRIEP